MPRYAPMGEVPQPTYRHQGREEEVEDFRQTFSMKNFSEIYKKILGVSDFLKRSLGSAMAEADRRRNMYGQAVGALLNLQNRAPRLGQRTYDVAGQFPEEGLPEEFELATEEHTRRATGRAEEVPFSLKGLVNTMGERGQITERAYKMRK